MTARRWILHRRRWRIGAALTAAVLFTTLSACGEPSPEEVRADYCETVKAHQKELTDIAADPRPQAIFRALPAYRDLAEDSPEDIAPDWARLIDRIEQLQDALTSNGVRPEDYGSRQWKQGLTQEQQDEIRRAATGLADPRTAQALADVQQQARDVCHTPLSL